MVTIERHQPKLQTSIPYCLRNLLPYLIEKNQDQCTTPLHKEDANECPCLTPQPPGPPLVQ